MVRMRTGQLKLASFWSLESVLEEIQETKAFNWASELLCQLSIRYYISPREKFISFYFTLMNIPNWSHTKLTYKDIALLLWYSSSKRKNLIKNCMPRYFVWLIPCNKNVFCTMLQNWIPCNKQTNGMAETFQCCYEKYKHSWNVICRIKVGHSANCWIV